MKKTLFTIHLNRARNNLRNLKETNSLDTKIVHLFSV